MEYLQKIFFFIAYSIYMHNNNLFRNVMIYLGQTNFIIIIIINFTVNKTLQPQIQFWQL